jgi:protein-tyrosine phosphatase
MRPIRILFVCLGNICRSPIAEAVFVHCATENGVDGYVQVDSAGTGDWHLGDLPDGRALATLDKHGLETEHLGRQVSVADFTTFDYIFGMDKANLRDLRRIAPDNATAEIHLFLSFGDEASVEVPDPYYGTSQDFDDVFELVRRGSEEFLAYLRRTGKLVTNG